MKLRPIRTVERLSEPKRKFMKTIFEIVIITIYKSTSFLIVVDLLHDIWHREVLAAEVAAGLALSTAK